MKQVVYCTLFLSVALSFQTLAQNAPLFPKGELATTKTHVGDVWLSEVSGPDSTFAFSIAQAVFAPGARLDWHSSIRADKFFFLPMGKATIRSGVSPARPFVKERK